MLKLKKKDNYFAEYILMKAVSYADSLDELATIMRNAADPDGYLVCPDGKKYDAENMANAISNFDRKYSNGVTRAYGFRQQCFMLQHYEYAILRQANGGRPLRKKK